MIIEKNLSLEKNVNWNSKPEALNNELMHLAEKNVIFDKCMSLRIDLPS